MFFSACGNSSADEQYPNGTEIICEISEPTTEYELDVQNHGALQALEDFLFPLLTIFDFGNSMNSGALISHVWRDEYGYLLDEYIWVNRYGETVKQPDFFRIGSFGCYYSPLEFALYDFNHDGIPVLLVDYFPLYRCGGFVGVYRFVDGEYKATTSTLHTGSREFFTDSAGRIVFFVENFRDGIYAYYHFTLHDEGAELELISQPDMETFGWEHEYYAWAAHHRYPYWQHSPSIFRMPEETLTHFPRLTELEEQITANIRHRHGLGD